MKRYFIDGCFDGFHYGHVHALYQAKQMCDVLVVATHNDEEMKTHKNHSMYSFNERLEMLKHCKYIDEIVHESVPYNVNSQTLDKYNCEIYVHGNEHVLNTNNEDSCFDVKQKQRYKTYNVTNGISSTNLLYRLYCYHNNIDFFQNLDIFYLNNLFNKLNTNKDTDNNTDNNIDNDNYKDNIIVINSVWDMITPYHIDYILKIKSEYPSYKIICNVIEKQKTIYNTLERAIILCGIKYIDSVIINNKINFKYKTIKYINYDGDTCISPWTRIKNNWIHYEKKFAKESQKLKLYKTLKKDYLDSGIYKHILNSQFSNILTFLRHHKWQENDIVILDIDEVCLYNLMYINYFCSDIFDKYDTNVFNYVSGLNPPIEECKQILDFLNENNINYAFITGRKDNIKILTEKNLQITGYNKYSKLYMMPYDSDLNVAKFKSNCREEIAKVFNIVCCIGDQVSDITGDNCGIPFLIFNPFYLTK